MVSIQTRRPSRALPLILVVALVQGVALYGMHRAIEHRVWPATSIAWLTALYAVVVFGPLTLQLLVAYLKSRAAWIIVAALSSTFFYFGWHHGAHVAMDSASLAIDAFAQFSLAFLLAVLWLHVMPFLQCRLEHGVWRVPYGELFATAWRNTLRLAEACIFTGLFWLLLFLWAMLFNMLGIGWFRVLFSEPAFAYPVTALTFGASLHLIGSIDRLTSVLLDQVLNVLKWLALLAGLILALFSVALLLKLPGLLFAGQRAIGAGWLLWLVAIMVLLVNAAYRDGSVAQPYPLQIGRALRFVLPLLTLSVLTALYALIVRTGAYGLTVQRVWAFIVAFAALAYAVGYTVAALKADRWMGSIARVNVGVTLGMIALLGLALTPALSPYRLAASSQYHLALRSTTEQGRGAYPDDAPFHYLRFNAGKYGREKLDELARLTNHPRAAEIRKQAQAARLAGRPDAIASPAANEERLAQLVVYPRGVALDPLLRDRLLADMKQGPLTRNASEGVAWSGLYIDMNDDGTNEFVLLLGNGNASVYVRGTDSWTWLGWTSYSAAWNAAEIKAALERGDFRAEPAQWKNVRIGRIALRVLGVE